MSKVSIKDVAREAGVSVSSLSFFMNRPERLSQASKDRIAEVCKRLNYAPGKNRRGPKLGRRSRFKTRNICFYCMNSWSMEELLRYPTMARFLGCVQDELHKHHCRLIISGTGDNCNIPVTLSKKNCDGVVLFGKASNLEFYKNFKEKIVGLPVIWTGAVCNDDANEFDHVFYDNKKIGELAAKYTASKQYTNVALFNSHPTHLEYSERIRYFEEAIKKYNSNVNIYKFYTSCEDAGKPMAELNSKLVDIFSNAELPKIDIGFFCSDLMLSKFNMEWMQRGNKKLDFEVFGCHGDSFTLSFIKPAPGTIDIRLQEIAKQTVKRLLHRIDNYRKPMETAEIYIEPQLIPPADN